LLRSLSLGWTLLTATMEFARNNSKVHRKRQVPVVVRSEQNHTCSNGTRRCYYSLLHQQSARLERGVCRTTTLHDGRANTDRGGCHFSHKARGTVVTDGSMKLGERENGRGEAVRPPYLGCSRGRPWRRAWASDAAPRGGPPRRAPPPALGRGRRQWAMAEDGQVRRARARARAVQFFK